MIEAISPPIHNVQNTNTRYTQHTIHTQVDDGIKYGMIEAISHLIHRDYDAIVHVS